jgi:hypothetical protein
MLNSPAWKDLNAVERAIYLELTYRYNGSNNGRISYSARQAAEALNISKDTAARGLRSLEIHGFIVAEKRGAFHCKMRHATEYRLTIYESDIATAYAARLATKEFMCWPGTNSHGQEKIQNTVPVVIPTVPVVVPIGPSGRTVSSKNSPDGPSGRTVKAHFAK